MHDALTLRSGADGQDKQNGALLQKMLHAIVKDLSYGCVVFAHHALHAVDRADHVRLVDHIAAAHADKEVFGMVRHANDLMRHDLPGRDDQIVALVHNPPVDLHADRIVPKPLGDLFKICRRNLADLYNIMPPVVYQHHVVWDISEHHVPLRFRHRLMRAERGHDVHLRAAFCQDVVIQICYQPRL